MSLAALGEGSAALTMWLNWLWWLRHGSPEWGCGTQLRSASGGRLFRRQQSVWQAQPLQRRTLWSGWSHWRSCPSWTWGWRHYRERSPPRQLAATWATEAAPQRPAASTALSPLAPVLMLRGLGAGPLRPACACGRPLGWESWWRCSRCLAGSTEADSVHLPPGSQGCCNRSWRGHGGGQLGAAFAGGHSVCPDPDPAACAYGCTPCLRPNFDKGLSCRRAPQ